jgi:hypothetical protein
MVAATRLPTVAPTTARGGPLDVSTDGDTPDDKGSDTDKARLFRLSKTGEMEDSHQLSNETISRELPQYTGRVRGGEILTWK